MLELTGFCLEGIPLSSDLACFPHRQYLYLWSSSVSSVTWSKPASESPDVSLPSPSLACGVSCSHGLAAEEVRAVSSEALQPPPSLQA